VQAEVISIGDEMTTGQRLDTNSQWLSQRLLDLGIRVACHTTVADDLEENVVAFRHAVERADVVIASGGLGPTADDLTREVLARLAGTDLVLDEASLAHIRGLFARRKRPMPERNVVQAMFPRGSRPIPNPEGTAPGIHLDVARPDGRRCHLFAVPGVPAEMRQMWDQSVVPALMNLGAGKQVIRHRRIKCFGVGESDLEQMLPDLIRRGREPLVGITVHDATITLRITATAATEAECFAQMEPTIATIRECLGTLIFGEEEDELEHAVLRLLAERGQTLSTTEWGLDGLLAYWLASAGPGFEGWVQGTTLGTTSQSQRDRAAVEKLQKDIAATGFEATDPGPILAQMFAEDDRKMTKSDYSLSAHLVSNPYIGEGQPRKVYFGLAGPSGTTSSSTPYIGHPSILKPRAAKYALNFLRLTLMGALENTSPKR
jgi:nicotinamide-nucleotide amidase